MEVMDHIPGKKRKVDWEKVAETAQANPGKWVKVPETLTSGMVKSIKGGGVRALPPGEYEVTTRVRETGDSQRDFYVKFCG